MIFEHNPAIQLDAQTAQAAAVLTDKIAEAHRKLRAAKEASTVACKAYDDSVTLVQQANEAVTSAERHLLAFLKGVA